MGIGAISPAEKSTGMGFLIAKGWSQFDLLVIFFIIFTY